MHVQIKYTFQNFNTALKDLNKSRAIHFPGWLLNL